MVELTHKLHLRGHSDLALPSPSVPFLLGLKTTTAEANHRLKLREGATVTRLAV